MNTHHMICVCHRCTFLGALKIGTAKAGSEVHAVDAPPAVRDRALPDTPVAFAAEAYLAAVSNITMIRHCIRTYRFGRALAEKAGAKPDLEVLYVASLLHDLGLETLFDGPEDFEKLGAREAKRFLLSHGHERLADQVAAAIEIHTLIETAKDPRPEVAYLAIGALCDVTGARLDQIEPRAVQEIVAEYPRNGTKDLLLALVKRQIAIKPQSNIARIAARVDFAAIVRNAPFAG
jgi:HD superfamily phosphodiesterase